MIIIVNGKLYLVDETLFKAIHNQHFGTEVGNQFLAEWAVNHGVRMNIPHFDLDDCL